MNRIILILTASACLVLATGCGDDTSPQDDAVLSDTTADADVGPGDDVEKPDDTLQEDADVTVIKTSPAMAYHEHALGELEEGVYLNQDDTVALWLEHPITGLGTGPAATLDTGLTIGIDELRFEYFYAHDHTFCWNDEPEGEPHSMTILDPAGNEILRLDEGEGCKTVSLEPGIYKKVFSHSGEGSDGELIFMKPADKQDAAALRHAAESQRQTVRASGSPCVATRTLTAGTIGQLVAGEIGLTNTCYPSSNTTVWVFDQNCPNFFKTPGAPQIEINAVYAGPNTAASVYSSSGYTGYSYVASASPGTLTCVQGGIFGYDLHWDGNRSFKMWANDPAATSTGCKATWMGPANLLPAGPPPAGEVWLYSEPGRTGIAYRFNGPCHDLCNITASQCVSSAWIAEDTVMTIYADPDYLGAMFAFQHIQDNLFQYDNMARSIYVESLAAYNNETTLISKKNCDYCNLIGMRLIENENLSGASLIQANLTNARIIGVDLSNSNASRAIFRGANMAYANLKGAVLSDAVFEGDDHTNPADLSYAYMPNAKLDHAHMNGVTANYAQIYGASATVLQATMVGIHLANAILSNMDFSQASMRGASLTGANLVSASFLGTDLTGADLVNAALQGTVFDGATLYGAKLQNSTLAFEPGVLTVTRLGDNNTLQVASVSFNATSLPRETTNHDTYCPYGGQSDDGNVWCDSQMELTAPAPPAPPACIPSPTQFCPRPTK